MYSRLEATPGGKTLLVFYRSKRDTDPAKGTHMLAIEPSNEDLTELIVRHGQKITEMSE